ncbi:MAG: hypothetical protein ACLPT4_12725 [Verrucomicrobiia bacterium]
MYAVLQTSLDQSISRDILEEAIMATEGLAKPDCARLQREAFGILVGSLSQDDALALQAALRSRGVETEVVDESVLPVLTEPKHGHALNLVETGIVFTDLYGQETSYASEQIVFAAGGGLLHLRDVQDHKLETVYVPGGHGGTSDVRAVVVTYHHFENLPEFRLELFVPAESPRVQWVLTKDWVLTVNDKHIRLRDGDQLVAFLAALGNALSPEQTNRGIQKAMSGETFVYPTIHAFEQEIIWSLYQMAKGSA